MLSAIKSHRSFLPALLLCLLALVPPFCWAGNLKVTVLLSDNSAPYLSFAKVFGSSLPAGMQAGVLEHPELYAPGAPQADLIVAVGMKAALRATAQAEVPVLVAMIPDVGYGELRAQIYRQSSTPKISAVYLNQPLERRLDFIRAALPRLRRIGLLYSPDTIIDIDALRNEIEKRGASLVAEPVNAADRLFSVLDRVLADSDVLLGIADSTIYSGSNIRNILLASFRHNIPMVGISKSYVTAGALCAIFSTPEQLAAQTAETVVSFSRDRQLPPPQYPAEFSIELNTQVARSLGIAMPLQEAIRKKMRHVQGERK